MCWVTFKKKGHFQERVEEKDAAGKSGGEWNASPDDNPNA